MPVAIHFLSGPKDGDTLDVPLDNGVAPLHFEIKLFNQVTGKISTALYERTNEINQRGEIIYRWEPTAGSK